MKNFESEKMGGVFSTELKEIEEIIVKSEYKEALNRIEDVQKKDELTKEESIKLKILKARIYLDIQPFSEALINAKQAYEESVKVNNPLLIFDSAIPYARSLGFLGFSELATEKSKHAIEVLTGLKDNKSPEYIKRKARILTYGININSEEYMDKLNQALDIFEEIEIFSKLGELSGEKLVKVYLEKVYGIDFNVPLEVEVVTELNWNDSEEWQHEYLHTGE